MSRRFIVALLVVAAVHVAVAAGALLLYNRRHSPQPEPVGPAAHEDFHLKPVDPSSSSPPAPTTPRRRKVQPGDTYWGLAQEYGVSVEELRAANGHSRGHILKPGEVLTIPGKGN